MSIDDFDKPLTDGSPKPKQNQKYDLWKGWCSEEEWKKRVTGDIRHQENLKKRVQHMKRRKGF
ncbi:hypothetical protein OHT59_28655 [Streptomyces sp. NBC_00243]|uniref:hypothetical protein n=1 Tax=Streptomyces sp. NBC_00243 TaxID=2975688 RepID=UPI002DD8D06A|nr:hypothetical protein [Streptomyces sp. NBC_00243]WRZ22172.1 hypothetical protein OHT59_28655 [Streptomyces sp. NBC_00243]